SFRLHGVFGVTRECHCGRRNRLFLLSAPLVLATLCRYRTGSDHIERRPVIGVLMNSKHSVHRRAFLRAMPLLASTGAAALAQDTASPAALQFELKIPKQRPYLALTPAEIGRAKDRAKRFGWAKIVIDHTLAEANTSLAAAWSELPPKGTFPGHTRLGSRLFGAALAFSLNGNRKYAEWTRDGLLAYAAIYPGLPLMSLRYKIQDSSL